MYHNKCSDRSRSARAEKRTNLGEKGGGGRQRWEEKIQSSACRYDRNEIMHRLLPHKHIHHTQYSFTPPSLLTFSQQAIDLKRRRLYRKALARGPVMDARPDKNE